MSGKNKHQHAEEAPDPEEQAPDPEPEPEPDQLEHAAPTVEKRPRMTGYELKKMLRDQRRAKKAQAA